MFGQTDRRMCTHGRTDRQTDRQRTPTIRKSVCASTKHAAHDSNCIFLRELIQGVRTDIRTRHTADAVVVVVVVAAAAESSYTSEGDGQGDENKMDE